MYIVSIEAWVQVVILLTCGPGVVIVNCLGQVIFGVELPVQRRLCPIFMSGVELPDIHDSLRINGLSTNTLILGRHNHHRMVEDRRSWLKIHLLSFYFFSKMET